MIVDPDVIGAESGDVVVAVAKPLWRAWIAEGSAAGEPPCGASEFHWTIGKRRPKIGPGGRVYIVAFGCLRGYAPLLRIDNYDAANLSLVRGQAATAVTITEEIRGFQGWRYRWWPRSAEQPFPDWRTASVPRSYQFPALRSVDDDAYSEVLAALARDDMSAVCELLRGLRFSTQPGDPAEDATPTAIVKAIMPRGRCLWESRLAPFLVAIGATTSEATAVADVIGPDEIEPHFDDWCAQFSVEWLRDAASKAQRFNPQYLTELCFGRIRKGFAARLHEINVDTRGALMYKVGAARIGELEKQFGREQLLKLAHWWVWAELWFAYNRAKQKRATVDLAGLFAEKIHEVVRANATAGVTLGDH